ncbi:histidine phosphatase family protein [Mesorhizobium sp. A556]
MICSGATAATRHAAFPLDEPLEAGAVAMANTLGPQLRRADRVWTGPALRARQTAQALGLQAVERPELADQDMGSWSGKTLAAISGQQPENIAAWLAVPAAAPHGGEAIAELSARIAALMDALLGERGHTIAVTHPAVVRVAVLHVLGAPLESFWRIDCEPLSVAEFRTDGRRWALRASGVMPAKAKKR